MVASKLKSTRRTFKKGRFEALRLSMRSRKELTREISARYRKVRKKNKSHILSEFVESTGYNRSYGTLLLRNYGKRIVTQSSKDAQVLIGYDPFLKSHALIELVILDTIWKRADIISLHMPYTKENEMKKSVFLINTARGTLINEQALAEALNNGAIAGAGLDVFEEEPYKGPLTELDDKILLTAHIASSAIEGRIAMENEALQNLITALRGIVS